jgi:acyl dehydratase
MTPAITDTLSWWAPFEALEMGQAFTTRGRTVTEADVVGFAALTGDWHPQHADAEWAAESPFGERVVCRAHVEVLWRRQAEVEITLPEPDNDFLPLSL